MSIKYWIGAALSLALCGTALGDPAFGAKANNVLQSTDVRAAGACHGHGRAPGTQKPEKTALATRSLERRANGLKPDLFLKRRPKDRGARGADQGSAPIRLRARQGYADPKKLNEVYTIPQPKVDVAQGLAGAHPEGDVKGWSGVACAADRRISRAQPGPVRLSAAAGRKVQSAAGRRRQADQARGAATRAFLRSPLSLAATGSRAAQQRHRSPGGSRRRRERRPLSPDSSPP